MKMPAILPKAFSAASLLAGLLFGAGCGSQSVPRDLMLEEASKQSVERTVAMKGEGSFLEGKVTALATVSRGFDRGVRGGRGGRSGGGNRPGEGIYDEGR